MHLVVTAMFMLHSTFSDFYPYGLKVALECSLFRVTWHDRCTSCF